MVEWKRVGESITVLRLETDAYILSVWNGPGICLWHAVDRDSDKIIASGMTSSEEAACKAARLFAGV